MKIGANEPCPCGSGKKYKRCCRDKTVNIWTLWRNNATQIAQEEGLDNQLVEIFYTLLKFISNYSWNGACHGASAILYVIYRELGFEAKLCTGVISASFWMSGHSWVELNDKIYDISCYFPAIGVAQMPPVFHGKELDSMNNTSTQYGISDAPHAEDVKRVMTATVSQVMAADYEELGNANLWQVLASVCMEAKVSVPILDIKGTTLDASKIAEKYDLIKWELRDYIKQPAQMISYFD